MSRDVVGLLVLFGCLAFIAGFALGCQSMSDEITAALRLGGEFPDGITESWRCPHCIASASIGAPAKFSTPPRCPTHG